MTSILSNKEAVKTAIETSNSAKEVLEALGLRAAGGNFKNLKKWVDVHGLVLPKYDPKTNVYFGSMPPTPESLFVENGTSNRNYLKKRLRGIWKDWLCTKCGLGEIWDGQSITLQLDHINGIHNDNRLENLRLLCPNCHSQTDSFAGRGRKTTKKIRPSDINPQWRNARRPSAEKIDWPPDDELRAMLDKSNYVQLGRVLGVSDKAIKKRLNRCSPPRIRT